MFKSIFMKCCFKKCKKWKKKKKKTEKHFRIYRNRKKLCVLCIQNSSLDESHDNVESMDRIVSNLLAQNHKKMLLAGKTECFQIVYFLFHHSSDESCSREKMTEIKTMQENLAQLHFDLENEDSNR